MMKKRIGNKRISVSLRDTDLWGLECILVHAQRTGFAKENAKWYEQMIGKIQSARGTLCILEGLAWQAEELA